MLKVRLKNWVTQPDNEMLTRQTTQRLEANKRMHPGTPQIRTHSQTRTNFCLKLKYLYCQHTVRGLI